MTTRHPSPVGDLLRQLRTAAALSQEELAERAGLSARGVSDLERGIHRAPRLETVRLLADALALDPQQRAAMIAAARPDALAASAAIAGRRGARFTLPQPPTRLVGREAEVATLHALLTGDDRRLVTLTGTGGTGKTRLAQAAAADVQEAFPDGVVFVDLAPLADPGLVLPRILAALGIPVPDGRSPLDAVAAALEGQRVLLLLDNFEHLLAAATVAADLLAASPGLRLLVTSRAPLRLRAEQEFSVLPLRLPDVARLPALAALGEVEAVALFTQCARAARADFVLTAENARTVAEICVRLDGLPLAIELAATRVKLLPLPALLARLEHRLPLLIDGARDLPARQQTLRDAIAWSYDLLTPVEQRVFRALAVFAGGATLDALEAVVGGDEESWTDALTGFTGLVEQSLLRQEEGPRGAPRFRMLETIREYALERLMFSGEEDEARRRHAAWCGRLAEQISHVKRQAILGNPHDVLVLETEYANLRAALTWLTETGDAAAALRLAAALGGFWNLRGHLGDGRYWLERTLAHDDGAQPRVRASALLWLAMLNASEESFALMEESLGLAREAGDPVGVAAALVCRAFATFYGRADAQSVTAMGEESLALFEAAEAPWGIASSRLILAKASELRGDMEGATARYEQLLAEFQEHGGDEYIAAQTCQSLGALALAKGTAGRAASYYAEGMSRFHALGDLGAVAWCLEGVATASGHDDPAAAARLYAAADGLRTAIAAPMSPGELPEHERAVASIRGSLGAAPFALAWSAGAALSLDAALVEARFVALAP